MSNSAQKHFNFCIAMLVLTFILPVGKLFVQFYRGLERGRAAILSDAFFVLAAAISFTNLVVLSLKADEEVRVRRTTDDELVIQMHMFAPKWLKVLLLVVLTNFETCC
jgi:hypothetical protein